MTRAGRFGTVPYMPRDGYRSVALTDKAAEELALLALDLSQRCRRRLTLSETVMMATEIATESADSEVVEAARIHAKR